MCMNFGEKYKMDKRLFFPQFYCLFTKCLVMQTPIINLNLSLIPSSQSRIIDSCMRNGQCFYEYYTYDIHI